MEFFRISRTIPFMRHSLALNMVSLVFFVAAVVFIALRGFNLSIEFTGGTVIELTYPDTAPLVQVREELTGLGYTDFQVQNFGTSRDVLIRLPVIDGQSSTDQSEAVMGALTAITPDIVLQRVEYVGRKSGVSLSKAACWHCCL